MSYYDVGPGGLPKTKTLPVEARTRFKLDLFSETSTLVDLTKWCLHAFTNLGESFACLALDAIRSFLSTMGTWLVPASTMCLYLHRARWAGSYSSCPSYQGYLGLNWLR